MFVRDRVTGATTRVSVATGGTQANNHSERPAISADGRYVAFTSLASNLVAGDTNGKLDVFVRDRVTGATTRVSVATGGAQANGDSKRPGDQRRWPLRRLRSRREQPGGRGHQRHVDVFVRDRVAGATTRVSVDTAGTQANHESAGPAISADGRYVAFQSAASNLVAGDTNGVSDVFVRDRLAPVSPPGRPAPPPRRPGGVWFFFPGGGGFAPGGGGGAGGKQTPASTGTVTRTSSPARAPPALCGSTGAPGPASYRA